MRIFARFVFLDIFYKMMGNVMIRCALQIVQFVRRRLLVGFVIPIIMKSMVNVCNACKIASLVQIKQTANCVMVGITL